MKVLMKADYGKLLTMQSYDVDSTTGSSLIEMGLAIEVIAPVVKRKKKRRKKATVAE